ncbi:hypothetical protein ACFE04_021324 [Oxalis oulophora]
MDESMVEDLELFVTSSRQYEKGGNDDDDEPNYLGVGEGITIRKRANIKSEMSKMEEDTKPPDSPVEDSPPTIRSQKSSHSANNRSRKDDKDVEASSEPLKPSKGSYNKKSKSRSKLACKGSVNKKSKISSKVQGSRKEENNKAESSKEENIKRGKRKRTWDLRGPAKCLELRKLREVGKVSIDFNRFLTPRGPHRKLYSSFLGYNVRLIILINVKSWDLVDEVDKEQLPEFDAISEKLSKRRNDQRHQAKVGRKGMIGCIDEHMEEGVEEPDRADGWMWVRMNASGGFDDPEVQVIVKFLKLKTKKKKRTLKLKANEDILSKAQRKRVRVGRLPACGFNATKGMLFPTKKLNAETAELFHLWEQLKKFKEGSGVSGENISQTEEQSEIEKKLNASQKKVKELEKMLADMKSCQEPYIPKFDNEDVPMPEYQQPDNVQHEGDEGIKKDSMNDVHSYLIPYFVNLPDSFSGKFTRGPFLSYSLLC